MRDAFLHILCGLFHAGSVITWWKARRHREARSTGLLPGARRSERKRASLGAYVNIASVSSLRLGSISSEIVKL